MFNNQQDSLPNNNLLVFIDPSIKNYQSLVDGVVPGAEAIVLNSREDGVEQITTILQLKQHVDTVHIISHGSPGCLYLGNSELSLDTLNLYSWDLHNWSIANLLLYGCNIAAGDAGDEFIRKLHYLTDADIAASAKRTGNRNKGGDWNLEVTTKPMEISLAFRQEVVEAYDGVFATYVVDTLNDEDDGVDVGGVSLRDAINAANASAEADTITFVSDLSGTISLTEGELLITDDLTIDGLGVDVISVNGNNLSRIFQVNDGDSNSQIEVVIQGLTITGGQVFGDDGSGGGILNVEDLFVNNSTITGNNADDDGGGIRNDGTLRIFSSTISNNTSIGTSNTSGGGGILNGPNGLLEIYNSTLNNNIALNGGAIRNDGTLIVSNSTLSGNFAEFGGGAIMNSVNRDGFNLIPAVTTITDSTIVDNMASLSGGGIANPGTATIANTIIARNTAFQGSDFSSSFDIPFAGSIFTIDGTLDSQGNNLIGNGDGSIGFDEPTDQVGTTNAVIDPLLGDLADNGGETATHALLTGSPAINSGSTTEANDQRNVARDANPDIGAFEFADADGDGVEDSVDDHFEGTSGNDDILGTSLDDTLRGNGGNDNIQGLEGADFLIAGDGNDTLTGGGGDDRIITGDGTDLIVINDISEGYDRIVDFAVGQDQIDVTAIIDTINYSTPDLIADGFVRLTSVGNGNTRVDIDVDGSLGDSGFQGLALLLDVDSQGLNWDDIFVPSNDELTVNNFTGTNQQDRLVGLSGNDQFVGLEGDDLITTGDGNDTVVISSLNDGYDRITDFAVGQDKLDVTAITDTINYSTPDLITDGFVRLTSVGNGNTRVDIDVDGSLGNSGFQGVALLLDVDSQQVNGDNIFVPSNDELTVNNFTGTNQQDRLIGLSGDDQFVGLEGDDLITTGGGNDTIVISSLNDGYDRIADFDVNNDQVDISAVLDDIGYTGTDAFGDGVLRWISLDVSTGIHSRLDIHVGNAWQRLVLLRDVELNDLNDSSFLVSE